MERIVVTGPGVLSGAIPNRGGILKVIVKAVFESGMWLDELDYICAYVP